jgi:hypothetical protein
MNQLKELSYKKMITIDGGDWLKDLGAWCHEVWCSFKESHDGTKAVEQDIYLNNAGSWGSMI